jgi:ABC-type lipoprotein export system ATPase subunit
MVTHEPDIAAFAKRVIVFRDGRIQEDELTSISKRIHLTQA